MTPASLDRALIDLGWLTLIQRVLGGKPSAAYALLQLMRSPGRPLLYGDFDASYCAHVRTGGSMCPSHSRWSEDSAASANAVRKRIERARTCLADLGVEGAIQTIDGGYLMERRELSRVQAALLFACGVELRPEDAAA